MASGKTEGNHILLRVAELRSQFANSFSQTKEECFSIHRRGHLACVRFFSMREELRSLRAFDHTDASGEKSLLWSNFPFGSTLGAFAARWVSSAGREKKNCL